MYGCAEEIEYVSSDRRTYRAYDVRFSASAMSMDQYRNHCDLYAYELPVYMKDEWIMHSSSSRPSSAAPVQEPDDPHDAYESYAVPEEPIVLGVSVAKGRSDLAHGVLRLASLISSLCCILSRAWLLRT